MSEQLTEIIYVRVGKELRKQLERKASDQCCSISYAAREAIVRGLDRTLVDSRERYETEATGG